MNRHAQLLWLLLAILPLASSERPLQYFYDQALAAEKNGETARAFDLAHEALRRNGEHVPSLLLLARLYLQNREAKPAFELVEKALRLDAKNADGYLLCAQASYLLRESAQLNRCLDETERLRPENPDAQSLRAQLLLDNGQYSLARRRIDAILRSHPGHTETHLRLAQLHLQLRQFEKAEQVFRHIQVLNPNRSEMAVAIARARLDAFLAQNRYAPLHASDEAAEKALAALRHAYSQNPENLAVQLMLVQLLALTGRCSEGTDYLAKLAAHMGETRPVVIFSTLCNTADDKLLSNYLRRNEDDDLVRHQAEQWFLSRQRRREHTSIRDAARYHRTLAQREWERNTDAVALSALRWAEFLFPGYLDVHRDLLQYFRRKKDFENAELHLNFLREATQEQSYRELYEQLLAEKPTLWYVREGFRQPQMSKNPLPVHIFPLKARDPFSDHPSGGNAIAERTRVALQDFGRVRSISQELVALPEAQFFSPENLRRLRQGYLDAVSKEENRNPFTRHPLALALAGSFRELSHGVAVDAELLDAETGLRLKAISFTVQGRHYLNRAAVRLAEFIYENAPLVGNILKIADGDRILLNIGRRDGLRKNMRLVAKDRLGRTIEFTVSERDHDIAVARSAQPDATLHLKAGDPLRPVSG
ncbi:MAG: tetratricopeptide repeat protein [Turneriella sp.]|nr:tetratricopeptide repeat protein [Turneriella sp.]